MTTGCDGFFASKVTVFVGERDGAAAAAAELAGGLACAGLAFEMVPCLQHEHLRLHHRGSPYATPGEIGDFLYCASRLRELNPPAAPLRTPPAMTAPTRGRIELRDHRHAVKTLSPLIHRRMRLATRGGRLTYGNWWLGLLGAGIFEVASEFGLLPPACGYDRMREPRSHVVLEVWPAGEDGARLDCVNGAPYTTMVHVPFGHDIALHLVDSGGMAGARARTDDNLKEMFG